MRRVAPVSVLTALLLSTAMFPVQAQTAPSRTITVTASAEVEAVPDRAELQLGVRIRAATAQAAMTQNNTAMTAVITALKGAGVPEADLQTSFVRLQPIYNSPAEGATTPPQLVGFEATNVVRAALSDLTKVAAAIDAGVTAGANEVLGIGFRLVNEDQVRQNALRQALSRARPKAEAAAAALGVTLGDVDAVVELTPGVAAYDAAAIGGAVPVLPGTVTLRVDAQVRYTIR